MRPTLTITYPRPSAGAKAPSQRKWAAPRFTIGASRSAYPVSFTPHTMPTARPPRKFTAD